MAVARRYDLHPHQIYGWRRHLRIEGTAGASGFVPVVMGAAPEVSSGRGGTIEISLSNGRTIRASESIVPLTLARLVEVLDRR